MEYLFIFIDHSVISTTYYIVYCVWYHSVVEMTF